VVPRDLLGVPILGVGIFMSLLPPAIADRLAAPILRRAVGDITELGFRKLPYGPGVQIRRDHRIPLLDIGTIALIRKGAIRVKPGVDRFTPTGVVFAGGAEEAYDAVILATGYRPRLDELVDDAGAALDASGAPSTSGQAILPGLYPCGFHVSPNGMLRGIAMESRAIAEDIVGRT
jgi:indole-3-pyruvate monooxygenase